MIRFHSANQIAAWLWVACILQVLQDTPLIVFSALCILAALCFCPDRCWRTLKRTRFLLLAIALVYGWATPGQYLWASSWSPTEEGVRWGLLQVVRLLGVLAALQLLLWRLNAAQVFSGLYRLLTPLSWLGLDRQRWALRLSLTMSFSAELLLQQNTLSRNDFLQRLAEAEQPSELQEVSILVESLSFFDLLLLFALLGAVLATLLMMV
ncbi:CbiQ family ECF transporter T component [Janthinobacterium sp. B9-8]|uniref:CbiQ family ECF transporter T component n=1 Tax=Janthinobacterium sp. B9-8 TaxID=1236179 RepID=UPI00069BD324|nr:CbiQ family ECF transporter T component [Janthinobacterium sp. B9-8]AMC34334.1 hypothetical protein VN23_06835 [Janthinobacterium sp. B9-8]